MYVILTTVVTFKASINIYFLYEKERAAFFWLILPTLFNWIIHQRLNFWCGFGDCCLAWHANEQRMFALKDTEQTAAECVGQRETEREWRVNGSRWLIGKLIGWSMALVHQARELLRFTIASLVFIPWRWASSVTSRAISCQRHEKIISVIPSDRLIHTPLTSPPALCSAVNSISFCHRPSIARTRVTDMCACRHVYWTRE